MYTCNVFDDRLILEMKTGDQSLRGFRTVRGTRDLLPPETALWNQVEQTAHEVFAAFNFCQIRTPIFESTNLFARAVGGATDIVGKEMYTFSDQSMSAPNPMPQNEVGESS